MRTYPALKRRAIVRRASGAKITYASKAKISFLSGPRTTYTSKGKIS